MLCLHSLTLNRVHKFLKFIFSFKTKKIVAGEIKIHRSKVVIGGIKKREYIISVMDEEKKLRFILQPACSCKFYRLK